MPELAPPPGTKTIAELSKSIAVPSGGDTLAATRLVFERMIGE